MDIFNLYLIRDKVALKIKYVFPSENDNTAVRDVCDRFDKDIHFSDLELWRFGYAVNKDTGDSVPTEKAVIALPLPKNAPKMPLGQGSATVEVKQ